MLSYVGGRTISRYQTWTHIQRGDGAGGAAGSGHQDADIEVGPGGDAEAGVEAGVAGSGDADAQPDTTPTCDDEIQNQGETGVDCGGPCPACAVLEHREDFDDFPAFGPDGAYSITGTCADDAFLDGWQVTDEADALFTNAGGYYAMIKTDGLLYVGIFCDDSLISPALPTNGVTTVTIEFDSSFLTLSDSKASLYLVRDGTAESVWSTAADEVNRHVEVGPLSVDGTSLVSLVFRYEGMYEFYWKVDNIVVTGD